MNQAPQRSMNRLIAFLLVVTLLLLFFVFASAFAQTTESTPKVPDGGWDWKMPVWLAGIIGGQLLTAIVAVAGWGRAQQKRGDKAMSGTIQLLEGQIPKLTQAQVDATQAMVNLTMATQSQKEALYRMRDRFDEVKKEQNERFDRVQADLTSIHRKIAK